MLDINLSEISDLSVEEIITKAAPSYISQIEKYEKLAIDEPEVLEKLKLGISIPV